MNIVKRQGFDHSWMSVFLVIVSLMQSATAYAASPALLYSSAPQLRGSTNLNLGLNVDQPRWRAVELNLAALKEGVIRLPLFDGTYLDVKMLSSQNTNVGDTIIHSGVISELENSSVLFAETKGILTGIVSIDSVLRYSIGVWPDGSQFIEEVAETTNDWCQGGLQTDKGAVGKRIIKPSALGPDSGAQIDVLAAYTPQARQQAGGKSGIESYINMGIAYTNQAFQNSGVSTRVRLVHLVELSAGAYEPGLSGTLLDLRNQNDGTLDSVHTLRNTYKADMVQLFVEDDDTNPRGITFQFNQNNIDRFENLAFTVLKYTRLRAIPHEFGHMLGVDHGRSPGSTDIGLFSYSHGFVTGSSTATTSDNRLTLLGIGTGQPINYFSNPNIVVDGEAIGIPVGQSGEADARLTINNSAHIAANWRPGGDEPPVERDPVFNPAPMNLLLLDE